MTSYISSYPASDVYGIENISQLVQVTQSQFMCFQRHFTACDFKGDLAIDLDFMAQRQQRLQDEQECEALYLYCRAGVYKSAATTEIWYETTKDTVLIINYHPDGVDYFIYIPASCHECKDHTQLGYILAGADTSIITAELNQHVEHNYKIWSEWYNAQQDTIPNWTQINDYNTEMRQRMVNDLLKRVHKSAKEYVRYGNAVAFDSLLGKIGEEVLRASIDC